MSPLNLNESDLEKLRGILGTDAPPEDPESPEFADAIALVTRADPELAQRFILSVPIAAEYDGAIPPLKLEDEARAARGRQRLIDLQRLLFMRQVENEWIASQPKIWAFTLVLLVIALGAATANYLNHTSSAPIVVEEPIPEPTPPPAPEPAALSIPEPAPAVSPRLSLDNFPALAPAPGAMPDLTPVRATTPPSTGMPPSTLPPLVPAAPQASRERADTLEFNPLDEDELRIPMTVSTPQAPNGGAGAPIGLYRQSELPPAAPGALTNRTLTTFRDATPTPLPLTNTHDTPAALSAVTNTPDSTPAANAPLGLFAAPSRAASDTLLWSDTSASASEAATLWRQEAPAAVASDAAQEPRAALLFDRSSSDAATSLDAASGDVQAERSAAASLASAAPSAGDRIPARLVTSATVLDGQSGPVVVESICPARDASCEPVVFFGRVTLLGGNRLVASLDQMLVGGSLEPVTGMILAPDMGTSLPAVLLDEAPALANDMLTSAISGVARYVDALASQTRVTVVDGAVLQESVVPPVSNFVAGNVAGLFNTRQARLSFVRVAEVPAGTEVVVLVGASF